MKPRALLLALLVLIPAGVCVRLGIWQLSRWHEKRSLNATTRAALAAPPLRLEGELPPPEIVRGRRVGLRGRWDESRQILLATRPHEGSPGVEVVTPLLPDESRTAVLVNRGWLYAADAATALPQRYPEPGAREVLGIAQPLERVGRWGAMRVLLRDTVTLWSARVLDRDSVAARLPYPVAAFVVRALPGPGTPAEPLRGTPRELNEMLHLSYAVQWFLFAAILLGGPAAFAWSRRRPVAPRDAADPDLSLRG